MKQVAELIFLFYMGGRPSKESLDFFLLVKYIQSMLLNIDENFMEKTIIRHVVLKFHLGIRIWNIYIYIAVSLSEF